MKGQCDFEDRVGFLRGRARPATALITRFIADHQGHRDGRDGLITSPQIPHIANFVVQHDISSRRRADISHALGFQPLPTSFVAVRPAPKRNLADSSDEEPVPTETHRSFPREPVVVHARRSPSNGRRGAAGSWLVSEPAGQVGGRAHRHSLWTSQPSTTSTNAKIPVG
jgi:hypothetical protein